MTPALELHRLQLTIEGKSIEVARHTFSDTLSTPSRTILLLHEALGSVSYWKDFPQKLALATHCNVLLYSRPGHGNSEGPIEERNDAYYLRQVRVTIPALLDHFSIERPIVYGHSEGAGIALLYAALSTNIEALILESPFVIANGDAAEIIGKMAAAYPGSKLQERLAHYHQQPDDVFFSWARWAAALYQEVFPLRDFLPRIACPVLALQGERDEFGAAPQLAALQAAIPHLQHRSFADTGHLPHREQTSSVLQAVAQFLSGL